MDSPEINGPVLETFHRDLIFVNKLLGTFQTIEQFLRKSDPPVRSVLDIGCGSGRAARLSALAHERGSGRRRSQALAHGADTGRRPPTPSPSSFRKQTPQ